MDERNGYRVISHVGSFSFFQNYHGNIYQKKKNNNGKGEAQRRKSFLPRPSMEEGAKKFMTSNRTEIGLLICFKF